MALRLCSYNIHRAIGRDGVRQPERIRRVLQEIDADVVALQEVEVLQDAPAFLDYLCEQSDWQAITGPTMLRDSGEYGNAVLTRLPVRRVERIDISQSGREPRGALRLLLDYRQGERWEQIDLFATHLGLKPRERHRQVRALLDAMETPEYETTEAGLSVLMGDLNEWFLWGRTLRWLRHYFTTTPAPATFPSAWPLFSLDRIWTRPRHRMGDVRVWKSRLARRASDHLPLYTRID